MNLCNIHSGISKHKKRSPPATPVNPSKPEIPMLSAIKSSLRGYSIFMNSESPPAQPPALQ